MPVGAARQVKGTVQQAELARRLIWQWLDMPITSLWLDLTSTEGELQLCVWDCIVWLLVIWYLIAKRIGI